MKNLLIALLLLALGAGGALLFLRMSRPTPPAAPPSAAGLCVAHQVPAGSCPFCDPTLVERMGTCPEHEVPEALCVACNPALEAGFRATGDWCAGHGVPESQCALCGAGSSAGELIPGQCRKHQLPSAACPFCDPALVEKMGTCQEHGVPEALCVACNPALEAGFRAAGDWCQEHEVPESQCALCGAVPPEAPQDR